jgi:transcriptional regulator with XRE-family HTH domain
MSRVRQLRLKHGWTQQQLAAAAGVDKATIGNVERTGRARRSTATELGRAFGLGLAGD